MMVSRRRLLSSFAASAALAACQGRTTSAAPLRYPSAQSVMDSFVAERKVSGAVASISKGGSAEQYLHAGLLAFDAGPCDPDSIYRIYSMTKPVTGIAAMQLIERGLLRLDQPIADIIPEFAAMRVATNVETMETRPARTQILVRHLLTHTGGLSYNINGNTGMPLVYRQHGITPVGPSRTPVQPGEQALPATLDEFATRLAALPLAAEPGTRWEYSVSLDLMGLIIQRVSGASFAEYLHQNIFDPLGMDSTGFSVPASDASRLTTNYRVAADGGLIVLDDRANSAFVNYAGMPCGGAGLASTTRDYSKFAHMLLNDGALGRVRILRRETAELARSNLAPAGVFMEPGVGFGAAMSVALEDKPGAPRGTFGWAGAAGTLFWVDPANRAYSVMMTQYLFGRYSMRDQFRMAVYQDWAA